MERIARQQEAARTRAANLRSAVPEIARRLERRGATRVRLFGSLATGGQPHEATDVDLCVEGLDDDAIAEALLEVEPLLGARVDIVRWETAGPRLKRRIDSDAMELSRVAG